MKAGERRIRDLIAMAQAGTLTGVRAKACITKAYEELHREVRRRGLRFDEIEVKQ